MRAWTFSFTLLSSSLCTSLAAIFGVEWGRFVRNEVITVKVGDTIRLSWTGFHNVVQHPSLSCNNEGVVPISGEPTLGGTFDFVVEPEDENSLLFLSSSVE